MELVHNKETNKLEQRFPTVIYFGSEEERDEFEKKLIAGEIDRAICRISDNAVKIVYGEKPWTSAMLTLLNTYAARKMLQSGVSVEDTTKELRQIAVSGVRIATDELDGGTVT